jgi:hypothetical protein
MIRIRECETLLVEVDRAPRLVFDHTTVGMGFPVVMQTSFSVSLGKDFMLMFRETECESTVAVGGSIGHEHSNKLYKFTG